MCKIKVLWTDKRPLTDEFKEKIIDVWDNVHEDEFEWVEKPIAVLEKGNTLLSLLGEYSIICGPLPMKCVHEVSQFIEYQYNVGFFSDYVRREYAGIGEDTLIMYIDEHEKPLSISHTFAMDRNRAWDEAMYTLGEFIVEKIESFKDDSRMKVLLDDNAYEKAQLLVELLFNEDFSDNLQILSNELIERYEDSKEYHP